MSKIVMFTSASCPFCLNAEKLLNSKGVTDIEKIRIDLDPEQRDMIEKIIDAVLADEHFQVINK